MFKCGKSLKVNNLLLALSSADFSSESNFLECRFGDVTDQFIGSCRALDSWFIQKRLILTMKRPECQLADEVADLRKELEAKIDHANCLKQKIREYVSSINTIVTKVII
uniref:Expressed conserved protein n=1 Tax=Echinococcus granulosus TaxID=6210 RepID=A0A068WAR0_ECHGR|nr:expressed conserved protein [Echinococcus granulosus]